jgi:hypothetical protein
MHHKIQFEWLFKQIISNVVFFKQISLTL